MIHIDIPQEVAAPRLEELLQRTAQKALSHQGSAKGSELSVLLADDALLQQLNREHLGEDVPTDVLSFPARDENPETGEAYLGDIAISLPRAQAQAKSAGHSLETELQLLLVHGVLHLLGHDHAKAKEKQRMWAAKGEILASLGLSLELKDLDRR